MQRQHEMLLLCRRLQHSGVGKYYGGILKAVRHAVYHYAIQLSRFHILLLHIKVAVRYSVIEHPFGYFKLRTFLFHRHQELGELHVCIRPYYILEIKRHARYNQRDGYQRTERLHQRYSGSLYSCQLTAFAKVSEGDKRGQKDSKRQCLWNEHKAHIPEELRQHLHRKSFTNQFVNVSPQELHHQHELADEECSHEEHTKLFGYEYI